MTDTAKTNMFGPKENGVGSNFKTPSKFEFANLRNLGVVAGELPVDIYNDVMEEIDGFKKESDPEDSMANNLASFIEDTYKLKKSVSSLRPYILDMAAEYCKYWGYFNDHRKEIEAIWVNMQKKHDVNPVHNHYGILSFVCWMDIPYSINEEWTQPNVKSSNGPTMASTFTFQYQNILGDLCAQPMPVERGWERRIVMFPAKLSHLVYPFQTSDEYRISIAGNILSKGTVI